MVRERIGWIFDFVTQHNVLTLIVMVVLTGIVVGGGIPQIDTESQASADSESFEDIDRVEKSQYIQENYGRADDRPERYFETVYTRQEGGNVLSKSSLLESLRYQQAVLQGEAVRSSLHEDGIVGIENLVATRAAGTEDPDIEAQIQALESTSAGQVEQLVAETLANDPRALRLLPSGHDPESTTATDRRTLVALSYEAPAETRQAAEDTLYQQAKSRSDAGLFVLDAAAFEEARSHFFGEMVELVLPVALLLILLVLAFAYRDLMDVAVGMAGVVLSVAWMFGLLGWLDVRAGMVSVIPVVLVTGLSIDFGFHVFNRYREQRGESEGIREPMSRGITLVATALILVTVTAAIGFLANLSNPLPVIRNLGVSITLGVVSALVIFVTVVPALKISVDGVLERFGLDRRKQALGHGRFLRPVLSQSVRLARRGAPVVLVVAIVIGAAGGVAWGQLDEENFQQADGEVAEWKQQLPGPLGWETHPTPERANHVEEVYQPASADQATKERILIEGDVTGDEALEDLRSGVDAIASDGLLLDQPGAQSVRSPVTVMQQVAQQDQRFAETFESADTDGNGVPDRNLAGLYDALYEADSEAASQVIERTDGEYRSLLVTLSLRDGYGESDDIVPALEGHAATMEGDSQRSATVAGGLAVNAAVLDQIVGGILTTMAVALVAIVLTLAAAFRSMHGSATLGAVVSIPIALVVGMVIGSLYLLDIPLTLLTALLMSLVIGLGVDYNIHIGDRFADELREGKTTYEALDAAVTGTGGALLGSTLTSAGAFATIALVPHPQLQSFGSIVVVALVTSFLVSVLVLPSALALWSRHAPDEIQTKTASGDALPQD